jgi:hypothetical protein
MSSRNMCLLPRATLHSDSEQKGSLLGAMEVKFSKFFFLVDVQLWSKYLSKVANY